MAKNPKRVQFESAVTPHLDELYGAAVKLTRSPTEAEDVLQDAVTRAWTFWDRFEEGTNARAWMHRILFNTFVNRYRKRKREREVLTQMHEQRVPEAPRFAESELAEAGLGDEVKAALEGIPGTFREVVELVDIAGASYKEAAARLQCPVGTIMSRLHRGRKLLGGMLQDYAMTEGYLAVA